jgi:hypothetical protein
LRGGEEIVRQHDGTGLRDRRVERSEQIRVGINADQLGGLAERVEERGDLGAPYRPRAIVILAADDRSA